MHGISGCETVVKPLTEIKELGERGSRAWSTGVLITFLNISVSQGSGKGYNVPSAFIIKNNASYFILQMGLWFQSNKCLKRATGSGGQTDVH